MTGYRTLGLYALAGVLAWVSPDAAAQERKAWKYVDENGNVVYSQTPPPGARDTQRIDIAPAHRGSGGSSAASRFDDPRRYATEREDQHAQRARERRERAEEARRQRLADLEAECNRNRGTDCRNPETLRLIEANRIPGSRRYPPGGR